MDISSARVADTQAAETVKPAQCAFDHPAPFSQPFARLDTVAGMYLSPRYARHQRQSALIDEQMVLATELAAVGGIGAGMLSAEGGMARWPSRY